jgi:hypothetical protein
MNEQAATGIPSGKKNLRRADESLPGPDPALQASSIPSERT